MRVSRDDVVACLCREPPAAALAGVRQWPPRRTVGPLIACLYDEGLVKWRAVSSLGEAVAALAEEDREAARAVVRRLQWSLSDESGGIGWGAPEALGEILCVHEGLAAEFGPLMAAYLRPGPLYLTHPVLQRGLLWGMSRMAENGADHLRRWGVPPCLPPYLNAPDPEVRGLAARVTGQLNMVEVREQLSALRGEAAAFRLYSDGRLRPVTVGALATAALAGLDALDASRAGVMPAGR